MPPSDVERGLSRRQDHWAHAAAAAKSLQSCPTLRPQRRQPTRLPRPRDSPGRNTGVGCHFLLQCMKVNSERKVAQSCPTLPQPHGLQPTMLLCPWDFPGKSPRVGCHCLLQEHRLADSKGTPSCPVFSHTSQTPRAGLVLKAHVVPCSFPLLFLG